MRKLFVALFLLLAAPSMAGILPLMGVGNTIVSAGCSITPYTVVTNTIGWWDVSVTASVLLSGSNVTGINDQSCGLNNLSTVGTQPVYSATSFNTTFPGITYSASNTALQNNTFAFGTGHTLTVWFVGQFTNSSGNYGRLVSYSGGTGGQNDSDNNASWLLSREGTTTSAVLYRNATIAHATFGAYGTPHIVIATIDSSGVMTIYIDGVATTGSTLNAAFGATGQIVVGNVLSAGNSALNGIFVEAGVSKDFTNSANIAVMYALIKTKWGL